MTRNIKRSIVVLVVLGSLVFVGSALAIDRQQARAEARAEAYTMVLGPGWRLGSTDLVGVQQNGPGKPQWSAAFVISRVGFGRTDICSGSFDITQWGHVEHREIDCSRPSEN